MAIGGSPHCSFQVNPGFRGGLEFSSTKLNARSSAVGWWECSINPSVATPNHIREPRVWGNLVHMANGQSRTPSLPT